MHLKTDVELHGDRRTSHYDQDEGESMHPVCFFLYKLQSFQMYGEFLQQLNCQSLVMEHVNDCIFEGIHLYSL